MSNSCDPMDCSPLGPSVHGIFHARIPKSAAISFSRGSGSSWPRDQTHVSCMDKWILYHRATRAAQPFILHKNKTFKIEVGDRKQIAKAVKHRLPFLFWAFCSPLRPSAIVTRCLWSLFLVKGKEMYAFIISSCCLR